MGLNRLVRSTDVVLSFPFHPVGDTERERKEGKKESPSS